MCILRQHKYPLITQKYADYLLFKQAVLLILNKEHLTLEGLEKIVAIKASMNLGLSSTLKEAFTDNITIVKRPIINDIQIKSPNWLAGFTSVAPHEGCFLVDIFKAKSGNIVRLKFTLIQHTRVACYFVQKNW